MAVRQIARLLITVTPSGVGYESGCGIRMEGDDTPRREIEKLIALHGIDDGHRVPHLLTCVAVIVQVDLLDGMNVSPRDVADDLFRNIFHGVAHFAGRERHGYVVGPKDEKVRCKLDALSEVVVGFYDIAKHAAHHVNMFHFLAYKLYTVEWRKAIALRREQLRQRRYEAY